MTAQYTHPSMLAQYPATPNSGDVPPLPPMPPPGYPPVQPPRKTKGALITAAIVGAAAIALTAGAIGGLIGNRMAASPSPQTTPAAPAARPAPTAEQVHAATTDLCSRFAGAYAAMPSPQNSGFDVIPTANYIADAIRDNPAADPAIREAAGKSLQLLRDHIAVAGGTRAAGAIQIPRDWSANTANDADQHVWDLCRAYGE